MSGRWQRLSSVGYFYPETALGTPRVHRRMAVPYLSLSPGLELDNSTGNSTAARQLLDSTESKIRWWGLCVNPE